MKLAKITIRELFLPFRFDFRHASKARSENHTLLIELEATTGEKSYGEILCREYLTGETVEDAKAYLREHLWPTVKKLEFSKDQTPAITLRNIFIEADRTGHASAFAGLDIAVHNLWAQIHNKRIAEVYGYGGVQKSIVPVLPIGLGMPVVLLSLVARICFKKVKCKLARIEHIPTIAKIRRLSRCHILVDANESASNEHLDHLLQRCSEIGVSCLEQPLPKDYDDELIAAAAKAPLTIMVDESLTSLARAKKLASQAPTIHWNLRLAKNGGYTGILEYLKIAQESAISCQLGVLVGETEVLSLAALEAAHLYPFEQVEYGFSKILLRHSLFSGLPFPWLGRINIKKKRGLSPRRAAISKCSVWSKVQC